MQQNIKKFLLEPDRKSKIFKVTNWFTIQGNYALSPEFLND